MLDLVKSHVKSDATVEEMDTERKIKFGFSSIICREDVDKTHEIIAVNGRIQKYCLSKGFSLLIIAISMHLA